MLKPKPPRSRPPNAATRAAMLGARNSYDVTRASSVAEFFSKLDSEAEDVATTADGRDVRV